MPQGLPQGLQRGLPRGLSSPGLPPLGPQGAPSLEQQPQPLPLPQQTPAEPDSLDSLFAGFAAERAEPAEPDLLEEFFAQAPREFFLP